MADIIKSRRDTAANWASANPILADGEIGVVREAGQPTRIKIGNGSTAWNSLAYASERTLEQILVDNTSKNTITGVNLEETLTSIDSLLLEEKKTGIKYGGRGTVSGGLGTSNTVNITAGSGIIFNNTNAQAPTYLRVAWTAKSNLALNSTSPNVTYWYVDDNSDTIKQTTTIPTEAIRKLRLYLFRTVINNSLITEIVPELTLLQQPISLLRELTSIVGAVRINGLQLQDNGANLNFNITSGSLYKYNSNYNNSYINPNIVEGVYSSVSGAFRYVTSNGEINTNVNVISPGNYQSSGTVTAIPGANTRIGMHFVWYFSSNFKFNVSYGTNWYETYNDAIDALKIIDPYSTVPTNYKNAFLIGVILVNKNSTDLEADATFISTNKFGLFENLFRDITKLDNISVTTPINLDTIATDVSDNNNHRAITTGNPHSVSASDVGLGNVNNTSDEAKPVSTAVSIALGDKLDITGEEDDIILGNNTTTSISTLIANVTNGSIFYALAIVNYPIVRETANNTTLFYEEADDIFVIIPKDILSTNETFYFYQGNGTGRLIVIPDFGVSFPRLEGTDVYKAFALSRISANTYLPYGDWNYQTTLLNVFSTANAVNPENQINASTDWSGTTLSIETTDPYFGDYYLRLQLPSAGSFNNLTATITVEDATYYMARFAMRGTDSNATAASWVNVYNTTTIRCIDISTWVTANKIIKTTDISISPRFYPNSAGTGLEDDPIELGYFELLKLGTSIDNIYTSFNALSGNYNNEPFALVDQLTVVTGTGTIEKETVDTNGGLHAVKFTATQSTTIARIQFNIDPILTPNLTISFEAKHIGTGTANSGIFVGMASPTITFTNDWAEYSFTGTMTQELLDQRYKIGNTGDILLMRNMKIHINP